MTAAAAWDAGLDVFALEDLLELLPRGVGKAQNQRQRREYLFEEGSQAHIQSMSVPSPRAFAPGAAARAFHIAAVQLASAEDLMCGLETTIYNGGAVGPFVLARAALEALGHSYMMLDPRLSAKERAAAALTSDLWSYHEHLRLERKAPSDPNSDQGKAVESLRASMRAFEREAETLGLRVLPGKGERAPAVERPRPSFTQVLQELLPLGSEPHGFGKVLATAYSAFAHADPVAILTIEDVWGNPVTNLDQVDNLALDEAGVVSLVWPVAVGHLATVERQINAYGWGKSMWQKWSRHAHYVIRRHGSRLEKLQRA